MADSVWSFFVAYHAPGRGMAFHSEEKQCSGFDAALKHFTGLKEKLGTPRRYEYGCRFQNSSEKDLLDSMADDDGV